MAKIIATCLYIGYLPFMPGTWASIAALGAWYALRHQSVLYAGTAFLFIILGFLISGKAEDEFGKKDPPEIVIDEFSSQLLVFVFIPFSLVNLAVGFVLFRILDILKPPPIKKIQNLPRGWGIMLDDVAVAIFVNLILRCIS